jgi:hypothetical protein
MISGACHDAAQCIDFLNKMAFANATHGGVTGHLTQSFDVVGQQQGAGAHTCRRKRGFSTGMAATDYNDIKDLS